MNQVERVDPNAFSSIQRIEVNALHLHERAPL
jgi:hypothetical protein